MDPYLLLGAAEAVGPAPIAALLAPDLDPERALLDPPLGVPERVRRRLANPDELRRTAESWQALAEVHACALLTPCDPRYPQRLAGQALRPLVLFAQGNLALLEPGRAGIAVVGSRTPTPYGTGAAEDFASALAAAGFVLWSGLAYGIDAIAHRCATHTRSPTVAVLAGGTDRIYPSAHTSLAAEILATNGLLLSEAPPGLRATRGHFPRRNRILAGGPVGVLVVEAGDASGSLITAHTAADLGTEVWAVPGPYGSPRSRGCHKLIAEGAGIACDPEHLLRELGVARGLEPDRQPGGNDLGADAVAVLRVLALGPRPRDLVLREARLSRPALLAALDELSTKGLVREHPGDVVGAVRNGSQR